MAGEWIGLTRGQYLRSVVVVVVAAPYVTILLGAALTLLRGEQTFSDASKVMLLTPISGSFMLVISCWWSAPATVIAVGALSLINRFVWVSALPSIIVAAFCIWQVPSMLSRFPNGDGGSMQTLVEQMKAVVAMSVGLWCLYFAAYAYPLQR